MQAQNRLHVISFFPRSTNEAVQCADFDITVVDPDSSALKVLDDGCRFISYRGKRVLQIRDVT